MLVLSFATLLAPKGSNTQHSPWCRLQVPVAVLAVHTAFHILYTGRGCRSRMLCEVQAQSACGGAGTSHHTSSVTGLTLVTPRWARQQNLDRVEVRL